MASAFLSRIGLGMGLALIVGAGCSLVVDPDAFAPADVGLDVAPDLAGETSDIAPDDGTPDAAPDTALPDSADGTPTVTPRIDLPGAGGSCNVPDVKPIVSCARTCPSAGWELVFESRRSVGGTQAEWQFSVSSSTYAVSPATSGSARPTVRVTRVDDLVCTDGSPTVQVTARLRIDPDAPELTETLTLIPFRVDSCDGATAQCAPPPVP